MRAELGHEPNDGSLFLFFNRNRDRLKALYWDRDGLALWYKRLESGTFKRISQEGATGVQPDAAQVRMLFGGISIENAKRRNRYQVT